MSLLSNHPSPNRRLTHKKRSNKSLPNLSSANTPSKPVSTFIKSNAIFDIPDAILDKTPSQISVEETLKVKTSILRLFEKDFGKSMEKMLPQENMWWGSFGKQILVGTWQKLLGKEDALNSASVNSKTLIFGGTLENIIKNASTMIQMGEDHHLRLPIIVVKCISFLESQDLKRKGIFRMSGNEMRLKRELIPAFSNPPSYGADYNLDNYSINDITSLLKRFLRELAIPLIPLEIGRLLITIYEKYRSDEKRIESIRRALFLLPYSHLTTFEYLFSFLEKVALFSSENEMTPQNIAIVLGPTLLRVESRNYIDIIMESFHPIIELWIKFAEKFRISRCELCDILYYSTKREKNPQSLMVRLTATMGRTMAQKLPLPEVFISNASKAVVSRENSKTKENPQKIVGTRITINPRFKMCANMTKEKLLRAANSNRSSAEVEHLNLLNKKIVESDLPPKLELANSFMTAATLSKALEQEGLTFLSLYKEEEPMNEPKVAHSTSSFPASLSISPVNTKIADIRKQSHFDTIRSTKRNSIVITVVKKAAGGNKTLDRTRGNMEPLSAVEPSTSQRWQVEVPPMSQSAHSNYHEKSYRKVIDSMSFDTSSFEPFQESLETTELSNEEKMGTFGKRLRKKQANVLSSSPTAGETLSADLQNNAIPLKLSELFPKNETRIPNKRDFISLALDNTPHNQSSLDKKTENQVKTADASIPSAVEMARVVPVIKMESALKEEGTTTLFNKAALFSKDRTHSCPRMYRSDSEDSYSIQGLEDPADQGNVVGAGKDASPRTAIDSAKTEKLDIKWTPTLVGNVKKPHLNKKTVHGIAEVKRTEAVVKVYPEGFSPLLYFSPLRQNTEDSGKESEDDTMLSDKALSDQTSADSRSEIEDDKKSEVEIEDLKKSNLSSSIHFSEIDPVDHLDYQDVVNSYSEASAQLNTPSELSRNTSNIVSSSSSANESVTVSVASMYEEASPDIQSPLKMIDLKHGTEEINFSPTILDRELQEALGFYNNIEAEEINPNAKQASQSRKD